MPEVMKNVGGPDPAETTVKNAEPTSFTFNAKRTLKKARGSTQKKPHAHKHRGRSRQENAYTYSMTEGGQTDDNGRRIIQWPWGYIGRGSD